MPRNVITERICGTLMYGDFLGAGYVAADETAKTGEKYYIQISAPGLTSHAVRVPDSVWLKYMESDCDMGTPIAMTVRSSVFNNAVYYSAEDFYIRDNVPPSFSRRSGAGVTVQPDSGGPKKEEIKK